MGRDWKVEWVRGSDGLLSMDGFGHNALQVALTSFILNRIPESSVLPRVGHGTIDEIACRAASAAAESIAHSFDILGIPYRGGDV